MSLAELTIPIRNLRSLPEGAVYTSRSGQATASARMQGDTILIYAQCDSLQTLVYTLEEELHRARNELEQLQSITEPIVIPFGVKFKWYLTGIITGIIALLIFQYTRKWKRKLAPSA